MKSIATLLAAPALFALAACSGNADDQAASNIEAMTENRADALEDAADTTANGQASDALDDRADNVREMGEDAADRADDNDDARVENQAAATMNRM